MKSQPVLVFPLDDGKMCFALYLTVCLVHVQMWRLDCVMKLLTESCLISFPIYYTAETNLRSPVDVRPKSMHVSSRHFLWYVTSDSKWKLLRHVITWSSFPTQSTLPTRLMECKTCLTTGDLCVETCDLQFSANDLPHVITNKLGVR